MDHSPFLFTARAANASPGTIDHTQIAVSGLLKLMARAEVQATASQRPANCDQPIKETS